MYQNGNRDDWRGAFAFVAERLRSGDAVMVSDEKLARYYLGIDTLAMGALDRIGFRRVGNVSGLSRTCLWRELPHCCYLDPCERPSRFTL